MLISKPTGWTSFDVVNKVRRILEESAAEKGGKKRFPVGHTGTLDPLATGLLILLLGSYTKRASEFSKLDKTYEVEMQLGQTSTTGDEEGEKKIISSTHPTPVNAHKILSTFVGQSLQTPPAYSAIKVSGQRAYKLARRGIRPKLQPRPITVHAIEEIAYEYPTIKFTACVSSGTYVRTLVEDMGKALGTGAYMSGLRRTQVGNFKLADALSIGKLDPETILAHKIIL